MMETYCPLGPQSRPSASISTFRTRSRVTHQAGVVHSHLRLGSTFLRSQLHHAVSQSNYAHQELQHEQQHPRKVSALTSSARAQTPHHQTQVGCFPSARRESSSSARQVSAGASPSDTGSADLTPTPPAPPTLPTTSMEEQLLAFIPSTPASMQASTSNSSDTPLIGAVQASPAFSPYAPSSIESTATAQTSDSSPVLAGAVSTSLSPTSSQLSSFLADASLPTTAVLSAVAVAEAESRSVMQASELPQLDKPLDSDVELLSSAAPAEVVVLSQETPAEASQAAASSSATTAAATTVVDTTPPAAAPAPEAPNPLLALVAAAMAAFTAAVAALAAYVASQLRTVPVWVAAQKIKAMKQACDEEPRNAEKHAKLLVELNKDNPKEVLSRVDSKQFGTNAAVVVEYLKALNVTNKISEYSSAGDEGGTLQVLLKDLLQQASGDVPLERSGASLRRPLHVVLGPMNGFPATKAAAKGPMGVLWTIISSVLVIVVLAFMWLVGSQAYRRVATSGLIGNIPLAGAATANTGAAAAPTGTPGMDPKEYKKDELPEKSLRSFKDVKGCDEAKAELAEVVEFLKNPAKFTRLGAKLPKGVLLTGPPGTGKTLLAKAVAGEAGVPFFYRSGSEFEELYVGVGSRRMRTLFAAAKKKAPCIVFIDEIDAIGGNRKHHENSGGRKTLNQLLVEMDGFETNEGVIVMAATNLAESLDPALMRPGRFDRQVTVALPDIKGRTDILDYYLADKPASPLIDRDLIARMTGGFSGADIANLVNEAALLAAKQGSDLIMPGMLDTSYDKLSMGMERTSAKQSVEALTKTAYHEGGHAIVALYMPGASSIHKATILFRGHALGMVSTVDRGDEFSLNRQQMIARIHVSLGGTVAEELIFGRDLVSSGATSDLRSATATARYMVTHCGLSDVIGPMRIDDKHRVSEALLQRVDAEVASMLTEARIAVKAMLIDKMPELIAVSKALVERETLNLVDIQEIVKAVAATRASADVGSSSSSSSSGGASAPKTTEVEEEQAPIPIAALALEGDKEAELVPVQAGGDSNR